MRAQQHDQRQQNHQQHERNDELRVPLSAVAVVLHDRGQAADVARQPLAFERRERFSHVGRPVECLVAVRVVLEGDLEAGGPAVGGAPRHDRPPACGRPSVRLRTAVLLRVTSVRTGPTALHDHCRGASAPAGNAAPPAASKPRVPSVSLRMVPAQVSRRLEAEQPERAHSQQRQHSGDRGPRARERSSPEAPPRLPGARRAVPRSPADGRQPTPRWARTRGGPRR